jgi:hypothetical protein
VYIEHPVDVSVWKVFLDDVHRIDHVRHLEKVV